MPDYYSVEQFYGCVKEYMKQFRHKMMSNCEIWKEHVNAERRCSKRRGNKTNRITLGGKLR